MSQSTSVIVPLPLAIPFQQHLAGKFVVATINAFVNELSEKHGFGKLHFVCNYKDTLDGPAAEIGVHSDDLAEHLRITPDHVSSRFLETGTYDQLVITHHRWIGELPINSRNEHPSRVFYAISLFLGELVKFLKDCDDDAFPNPIRMEDLLNAASDDVMDIVSIPFI